MPDYILHNDHRRVLCREQSSEDTDAIESHITSATGNGSQNLVFQQINSMTITPEGQGDTPERQQWSASGPRKTFIRHRCAVEAEIPLTAGVATSDNAAGGDDGPRYEPFLKAASLVVSSNGASNKVYKPTTVRQVPGITIYQLIREVEQDQSRLRFATDIVGSLEFTMSAGEEAMASFSGNGYFLENTNGKHFPRGDFIDDSDGELRLLKDETTGTSKIGDIDSDNTDETVKEATSQSLADQNPMVPREMTFTVGGNSYEIGEMTLDLGWSQDPINAITRPEGKIQHYNTRGPAEQATGGFDLANATTSNFKNLLDDFKAANSNAIVAELKDIRTGTPKSIKFELHNVQLEVPEESEQNNMLGYQFNFKAHRNVTDLSGDNDLTITYST